MNPRLVEEICREAAAIGQAIGDIKPGSHKRPHEFPEEIIGLQKRQRALEVRIRQCFAGGPFPKVAELGEIKSPFR